MASPHNASTTTSADLSHAAVAPAWHTIVVLISVLGLSFFGSRTGHMPGMRHGRIYGYVMAMVFEWVTVAFIWWGVSRRGIRLQDLVRGRWRRPLQVLRDLGIGVAFLIVAGLILNAIGHLLRASTNDAIRNLLPRSPAEKIVFLLVALTAGFCEEVMFRGYLQRQFTSLTRSTRAAIVLQGIAFGAAHGYQGWKLMLVIAVFGSMFGLLALWRDSLRPGMIAHFLQDGIAGLLGSHFMH